MPKLYAVSWGRRLYASLQYDRKKRAGEDERGLEKTGKKSRFSPSPFLMMERMGGGGGSLFSSHIGGGRGRGRK